MYISTESENHVNIIQLLCVFFLFFDRPTSYTTAQLTYGLQLFTSISFLSFYFDMNAFFRFAFAYLLVYRTYIYVLYFVSSFFHHFSNPSRRIHPPYAVARLNGAIILFAERITEKQTMQIVWILRLCAQCVCVCV